MNKDMLIKQIQTPMTVLLKILYVIGWIWYHIQLPFECLQGTLWLVHFMQSQMRNHHSQGLFKGPQDFSDSSWVFPGWNCTILNCKEGWRVASTECSNRNVSFSKPNRVRLDYKNAQYKKSLMTKATPLLETEKIITPNLTHKMGKTGLAKKNA